MRIDEQFKQQLARELCAIIDGWTITEAVVRMLPSPSASVVRYDRFGAIVKSESTR